MPLATLRLRALPLVVVVLAAMVGACSAGGSAAPSPAASNGGPAATGATGPGASIDPLKPYPNADGQLVKVRFAQSVPALSFAPFIVARRMNFFGYQGVDLELVELQSGATALQAVSGGSVDLSDSASTEIGAASSQGLDVIAIQNTIMQTLELCATNKFLDSKGVKPDAPLEARLKALEGARIAITGPGAVSDRATRFLLKKYGGLDPDTQTQIIQVGGAGAISGAMDSGQVDAFLLSPPNCGRTKDGVVLVKPADVPEFANYVHEVVYGSRQWIEANKDAAKRAATAVSMGNNFILKYPEDALKLLQEEFKNVDPAVIEKGFRETILPQIKPDGKMDAAMWQNTSSVLLESGQIDKALDTAEGKIWTSEYIGDASVR